MVPLITHKIGILQWSQGKLFTGSSEILTRNLYRLLVRSCQILNRSCKFLYINLVKILQVSLHKSCEDLAGNF